VKHNLLPNTHVHDAKTALLHSHLACEWPQVQDVMHSAPGVVACCVSGQQEDNTHAIRDRSNRVCTSPNCSYSPARLESFPTLNHNPKLTSTLNHDCKSQTPNPKPQGWNPNEFEVQICQRAQRVLPPHHRAPCIAETRGD